MTLPPESPSEPPQGQQPFAEITSGSESASGDASQGRIMRCRRCEQDPPEGAMFCPRCGTPIEVLCGSCRAANSPGSTFCMTCGHPLGAQAETATAAAAQPIPDPASPHSDVTPATSPPSSSAPTPSPTDEVTPYGSVSCPRCHKANEQSARYCYSCGLPLDETRKAELPTSPISQEAAFHDHPAGFWVRLIAFVIDITFLIAVFFAIWPSIFGVPYIDMDSAAGNFDMALGFGLDKSAGENLLDIFIQAAYFTLTTSLWGTTLGKRVFNLYVVGDDGQRLSVARSLGRYFATWVSGIIIGIGYIMIGVRADKRALHDLIAETWVVRRSR